MMSLWVLLALRLIFSYLMSHFGFLFQVSLLWMSTWRCGEVPVTYCALELSLSCMEWFWWSLLMISLDSEFSPVLLSWIFTWCWKVLVTLGTLQWFLFFMDPLMVLYLDPEKLLPHFMQLNGFSPVWFPSWIFTWCGKAPVRFGTLQQLFPSWILWYYFKSLWEALATINALVWLLSSVIPFMNLHLMWKSSCNILCTSMVDCFFVCGLVRTAVL